MSVCAKLEVGFMTLSKAWDWNKEKRSIWLEPSEDSYYIVHKWKAKNFKRVLDFGCGLGRHAIFFAKQGFDVSAFDLSDSAIEHLRAWAERENLTIDIVTADMHNLPYADNSFDAIFAYHVISHTDSVGIEKIISEISRVLKVGGEIYLSLCSKETWSFTEAGFPKLDENTVIKIEDGPENGIPHFYVTREDILDLFANYNIERIRHVDDCYYSGAKQSSKHYYIAASLLAK